MELKHAKTTTSPALDYQHVLKGEHVKNPHFSRRHSLATLELLEMEQKEKKKEELQPRTAAITMDRN